MTTRTRLVLVLGIAVATATLSSYAVYRIARQTTSQPVARPATQVVVAARARPIGTRLTADDVRLIEWPADHPLASTFSSTDAVVGRGLVAAVVENEPLMELKLAPREAGAGLPPAIPPGKRAISVKVNEVIGVAGFVVPGTHVDVIATIRGGQDASARVLVSNALVLTAGTRYDQEHARDAKPIPSTVVTLLVAPEQAERIALAQVEGQLTLMLRNPLDVDEVKTSGARLAALHLAPAAPASADARPVRARPAARKAAVPRVQPTPPRVHTVETILAGKRGEESVK